MGALAGWDPDIGDEYAQWHCASRWDKYVSQAPNSADAMARFEEAVSAGADIGAMLAVQAKRHRSLDNHKIGA